MATEPASDRTTVSSGPTFRDLTAEFRKRRNYPHTVEWIRNVLGAADEDPLSSFFGELRPSTDEILMKEAKKRSRKRKTLSAKRSRITKIGDAADALIERSSAMPSCCAAAPDGNPWPIVRARIEESGLNVKKLAELTGIPHATLHNWIHEQHCTRFSRRDDQLRERLVRLAAALDLNFHATFGDIPALGAEDCGAPEKHRPLLPNHVRYHFKRHQWPDHLDQEFQRLITFHTALTPPVRPDGRPRIRHAKAMWSRPKDADCPSYWYAYKVIGSVIGFATLPADREEARALVRRNMSRNHVTDEDIERATPWLQGIGCDPREATLGWLVRPDFVSQYLEWLAARNGGYSDQHRGTLTRIKGWLHPEHGFITQDYVIAGHVMGWPPIRHGPLNQDEAEKYRQRMQEWRGVCEDAWRSARQAMTAVRSNNVPRKPRQTSRTDPITEHPRPLQLLRDLVRRYAAHEPTHLGRDMSWMVWARNITLLELLRSNPVRNRNVRELRYSSNNRGSLRRTDTGYRLVYGPTEVKNGERGRGYDAAVSDQAATWLEWYLREVWPDWPRKDPNDDVVFLSWPGTPMGSSTLSNIIHDVTTDHIGEGLPGFRSHAIRHIVATGWLKENPNDFLTVSIILDEKLETVMENYAHLRVDDGLCRYHAAIDSDDAPTPPTARGGGDG